MMIIVNDGLTDLNLEMFELIYCQKEREKNIQCRQISSFNCVYIEYTTSTYKIYLGGWVHRRMDEMMLIDR